MVINTGTLSPAVLRDDLEAVWGVTEERYVKQYPDMYEVKTSKRNYERRQEVTGFGLVPEKAQGGDVKYFDPLNGYYKDIVNQSFGMGFVITEEMRIYEQYELMAQWTQALRQSVDETIDVEGAWLFNNAYDSTAYTLGDGVELCGTHLLPNGGTVANELSVASDLAEASLRQMIIDVEVNFVDGQGKKIATKVEKLLIHPNDMMTAAELLGSDKVPETNNNAINPLKQPGFLSKGYKVCNYFTDTDAFFGLTNHSDKLIAQMVKEPTFGQENDFDSDNMKMKASYIMAFGAYNFRSIFGSPGAA
jgi:hypothetical protein